MFHTTGHIYTMLVYHKSYNLSSVNRQKINTRKRRFVTNLAKLFFNNYTLYHRLIGCGDRAVIVGWLCTLTDCIDNIHSVGHISECSILTVKEGTVLMNDKKTGSRHCP